MGVDHSSGDKFRRTFRLLDCTEPKLCRLEMESMADEIDALRADVDLLTKQRDAARRGMESAVSVAELAWGGEIPSPLPFHRSSPDDLAELDAEEIAARDNNCPYCGGSGHMDDVSEDVTVLRWIRYDGTESACPPRGEDVLLRRKGHIWHETVRGFWSQYCGTKFRLRWHSTGDSEMEWANLGDEWALLAAAPTNPSTSSCPACCGSGVVDDGR